MNPSSLAGHVIELVEKVAKSDLPTDKVVADFYKERHYLGSHDRRWITEKTYAIVRNFLLLKDVVGHCQIKPPALGMFLANEFRMGETPSHLVSEYSKMLESFKIAGTDVNANELYECVQRRLDTIRNEPAFQSLLNSFPEFFSTYLPPECRHEATNIMEALNREATACLRVNINKVTRDEVVSGFKEIGVNAAPSKYSPIGIYLPKRIGLNDVSLYRDGLVEVQDEASQLVGMVINPQAGETIVDACAGAGGKSLELASLSNQKSKIFALDINQERLDALLFRAKRSGFENISTIRVDSDDLRNANELISSADKVVIDAPCTGSGTIRRNPDKKFRLSTALIEEYAGRQKILLNRYAQLARPGGLVYYATCSLFETENQSVVEWFLASNPNFEKVDLSSSEIGRSFPELFEDGYLMIYPHKHDMDGFFTAAMRRRTDI